MRRMRRRATLMMTAALLAIAVGAAVLAHRHAGEDAAKAAQHLAHVHPGGIQVEGADAAFVREQTGFAIGGVAPIGHARPVTTLIDADLLSWPEIWAAAGHPNTVFRLTPTDLVRITSGRVVAVK